MLFQEAYFAEDFMNTNSHDLALCCAGSQHLFFSFILAYCRCFGLPV